VSADEEGDGRDEAQHAPIRPFLESLGYGNFWKHKFAASFWKRPLAVTANGCFQSQPLLKVEFQSELEAVRLSSKAI